MPEADLVTVLQEVVGDIAVGECVTGRHAIADVVDDELRVLGVEGDASLVAKAYSTDHHELVVRPDSIALTEKLVRHFDEPFADSSAIPTFLVAQLARESVTVALSGDGNTAAVGGQEDFDGANDAGAVWIALFLLAAGLAHGTDLWMRWRRRPHGVRRAFQ